MQVKNSDVHVTQHFWQRSLSKQTWLVVIVTIDTFLAVCLFSAVIYLINVLDNRRPDVFLLKDNLSTPYVYYGDSDSIMRPYQLQKDELLLNFCNMFSFFYSNMLGDVSPFYYEKAVYFFHNSFYESKIKKIWEDPGWLLKKAQETKALSYSYMLDFKILENKDPYRVWFIVLQTINPYSENQQYRLIEYTLDIKETVSSRDNPWSLSIINLIDKSTIVDNDMMKDLQSRYPEKIRQRSAL